MTTPDKKDASPETTGMANRRKEEMSFDRANGPENGFKVEGVAERSRR